MHSYDSSYDSLSMALFIHKVPRRHHAFLWFPVHGINDMNGVVTAMILCGAGELGGGSKGGKLKSRERGEIMELGETLRRNNVEYALISMIVHSMTMKATQKKFWEVRKSQK